MTKYRSAHKKKLIWNERWCTMNSERSTTTLHLRAAKHSEQCHNKIWFVSLMMRWHANLISIFAENDAHTHTVPTSPSPSHRNKNTNENRVCDFSGSVATQKVGVSLIENDISCRKYYYYYFFVREKPSNTMAETVLRKIHKMHSHGKRRRQCENRELKTNTERQQRVKL